jgi:hypothetical protein
MNIFATILLVLALFVLPARAEVGTTVEPLPCGIYDESAKPLAEKDLDTQSPDRPLYTMGITTKSGKNLSVEVKSVKIKMDGERNQVSVFLDGKPYAKTSHQDVPLYLEVHIDNEKYRIICVRVDESEIVPLEPERGNKQDDKQQQDSKQQQDNKQTAL